MNIFNFKKLQTKLLFFVFIPVTLSFVFLIGYFSITLYNSAFDTSIRIVTNKASESASEVSGYVSKALASCKVLCAAYEEWYDGNSKDKKSIELLLKKTLSENSNYLSIYGQFEYNELETKEIKEFNQETAGKYFGIGWFRSGDSIVVDFLDKDYAEAYTYEYYTIPKKTKKECVTEPYFWTYEGDVQKKRYYETTCSYPIFSHDTFHGVVGIDIELSTLHKIAQKSNIYKRSKSGIFTNSYLVAIHSDTALFGKRIDEIINFDTLYFSEKIAKENSFYFKNFDSINDIEMLTVINKIKFENASTDWYYFIQIPVDDITAEAENKVKFALTIGVLLLILLLGILYFISKNITDPIHKGVLFAHEMANGSMFATFESKSQDEIKTLADSLNSMASRIKNIMISIKDISEKYQSASLEIKASSANTAMSSAQQAASIEEISVSMEEMVATINQNADNAEVTDKMASKLADDIARVSQVVDQTVDSLKTIVERISVISDFAEKTDILAINAAIEAARAGEYGKGFAIVANEIRNLSENSQKAALIISELSTKTVADAENSNLFLTSIDNDIKKTSSALKEISMASTEQKLGAQQINIAINQLNTSTQENAAMAEQLSAKAEELTILAKEIMQLISFFKLTQQDDQQIFTLREEIINLQKKLTVLIENNNQNLNNQQNFRNDDKVQHSVQNHPAKGTVLNMEDDLFEKF